MYAWVNDRDTLRKAGGSSDPYALFTGMLAGGNPPIDWPTLLAVAQEGSTVQHLSANSRPWTYGCTSKILKLLFYYSSIYVSQDRVY